MTRDLLRLFTALGAVAALTALYFEWLHVTNPTIVALSLLLVVLVAAAISHLWIAIATSVVAMLCVNFFFMPPVGTFTIADPQNWVALVVFLAVSLVASNLSSVARARADEALARRDEVGRLFDLSRDVLLMTDSREAVAQIARFVARRFDLEYVAICMPEQAGWSIFEGGGLAVALDQSQLSLPAPGANGHRTIACGDRSVDLVPLRFGTRAVGLLATSGRSIDPGTLDAVGGLAAIAVERVQFLEERESAEVARRSEALKSALLASLGHDLRTPLTAIRVAASNLQGQWLNDADRREQSQLVLAEVERLTRLFQNILEMARIEAGTIAADLRWVHPSEIIEGARAMLEQTLDGHRLDVEVDADRLVRVDPRLTAAALSHLLENAAQYAPAASTIDVRAAATTDGLMISVRDRGPGVAPVDLPHLFERFYRGVQGKPRVSGTGMGLSIARGLLVVEHGRIAAENCADGGARFTIVVPAEVK
jgi:two-component system, OmpR family, sensor histidine kinase KdpD